MGNRQVVQPFTRKDLEVLVKLSGKTENEIENWYNEFHIESNETDRMNKRQFQTYYTKLRKNPRLNQITDHIFRVFDKDNSGRISNFFCFFLHKFPNSHFVFKAQSTFVNFFSVISLQLREQIERNSNMHSNCTISTMTIESIKEKRAKFWISSVESSVFQKMTHKFIQQPWWSHSILIKTKF